MLNWSHSVAQIQRVRICHPINYIIPSLAGSVVGRAGTQDSRDTIIQLVCIQYRAGELIGVGGCTGGRPLPSLSSDRSTIRTFGVEKSSNRGYWRCTFVSLAFYDTVKTIPDREELPAMKVLCSSFVPQASQWRPVHTA